jgi:hypothetical protein
MSGKIDKRWKARNDPDSQMSANHEAELRQGRLAVDFEELWTASLTSEEVEVVHQWLLEVGDRGKCSDHDQIAGIAIRLRSLSPKTSLSRIGLMNFSSAKARFQITSQTRSGWVKQSDVHLALSIYHRAIR